MTPGEWRKFRCSQPDGNCVEVGRTAGGAAVRDSRDRTTGYLTATDGRWQGFPAAVRTGRFT